MVARLPPRLGAVAMKKPCGLCGKIRSVLPAVVRSKLEERERKRAAARERRVSSRINEAGDLEVEIYGQRRED